MSTNFLEQVVASGQATLANLRPQQHTQTSEASEWGTPAHREVDPFDEGYDLLVAGDSAEPGLLPAAKQVVSKGFHVFGLTPKDKIPLPGSQGFKDSKSPSDPLVLAPWNEDPNRNVGIDLGASDLCVLDFDKPESIPAWLNETKTYKVKTAKGVHVYFRGARPTKKLYVEGKLVGDIKSTGGYVLAAGSIHPSGASYAVIDDSPIVPTPEGVTELVKNSSERNEVSVEGPIIEGSRNTTLTSILGKARQVLGMNREQLFDYGRSLNQERCQPPLPDSEVRTIANSVGRYEVKEAPPVIMGGMILGQPTPQAPEASAHWRTQFRNLSEMEQGDVVMVIDGALQEGTCFIGADPGHGKTLVALAFSKAITLGEPLFGISEYTVKQPRNVIYLIPESGDRAFRHRGEAFRLPPDDRFIARTISAGGPLALSDPALIEAVRQTKPVVILDTASRFLQANDENSAAQNRLLVNDIVALRAAGAVCVIILHHAKKATNEKREAMTLQNMLRGTTDFGAMCDQAYGIRMDEHLYNRGAGPMEIELVNLKDRERLGGLTSIRLAASYKNRETIFPKSYIDETGNFRAVDYKESKARDEETLNALVQTNPMMTITELCEATSIKAYVAKDILKRFGWHMAKGGTHGHSPWHKDSVSGVCPFASGKKGVARPQTDEQTDKPQEIRLDLPVSQA